SSQTYDLIIIGGGTSGLTLAGRLSTLLPHHRLLVLERGHNESTNPLIHIPGKFGEALSSPLNYGYTTTPQKHLDNRVLDLGAGRMLGGTSALNFLIWHSGCGAEYDVWEALGNKGWNGREMMRAIRKIEGFVDNEEHDGVKAVRKERHGVEGPLKTGFAGWYPPNTTPKLAQAYEKNGVAYTPDPMGGQNEGMTFTVMTVDPKRYTRTTSQTAFEALQTGNVDVLTGATVARVVLEDVEGQENLVATGVEFLDEEDNKWVVGLKQGGEVVVCGGYVQSPKILELSGIGKREVLEKTGVPVKVENPNVGENLQDHQFVHLSFEHAPGEITRDRIMTDPNWAKKQMELYQSSRTGFYTGAGAPVAVISLNKIMSSEEIAALSQKYGTPSDLNRVDMDPFLSNALPRHDTPPAPQIEILMPPWKISSLFEAEEGKTYTTFTPVLMHPLGRGSVHIRSSNPHDHPDIDLGFYSHPLDKEVMIAALKFAAKVTETEPLAGALKRRMTPREGELTDEEWWEHIKRDTHSAQHAIGSCSMLPRDKGGVVDDRARVYGVKGLRVCDGSIAPLHFSAHSQATIYGMAELVAEKI
ncbi:alcohol oxidase, partial [Ascodesmis nigricans]